MAFRRHSRTRTATRPEPARNAERHSQARSQELTYRLPASSLTFTVPRAAQGGTDEAARRAVAEFVAGGVHMQLERSTGNTVLTNGKLIAQAFWTVAV